MSMSARDTEQVLEQRRRAEEARAQAAEHRARAHELRAGGNAADEEEEGVDSDAFLHAGIEEVLADIAELRTAGFEERAASGEALIRAADAGSEAERDDLLRQASAAVIRAAEFEAQAMALRDELAADPDLHDALCEAALARARARAQRAEALVIRAELDGGGGAEPELQSLRAAHHEAWADVHERLALAHRLRGEGLAELAASTHREAEQLRDLALATGERLSAAERGLEPGQAADAAA